MDLRFLVTLTVSQLLPHPLSIGSFFSRRLDQTITFVDLAPVLLANSAS